MSRHPLALNQQQYQAPMRTYNPPPPMPRQGPTGAIRQPNTQPTPPTNKGYSIFGWLKKKDTQHSSDPLRPNGTTSMW